MQFRPSRDVPTSCVSSGISGMGPVRPFTPSYEYNRMTSFVHGRISPIPPTLFRYGSRLQLAPHSLRSMASPLSIASIQWRMMLYESSPTRPRLPNEDRKEILAGR